MPEAAELTRLDPPSRVNCAWASIGWQRSAGASGPATVVRCGQILEAHLVADEVLHQRLYVRHLDLREAVRLQR
jgi:hypothetical protein